MPRTPQEKSCYVAVNPAQEEKLELDRNSDQSNYVLPDGQQVKVLSPATLLLHDALPLCVSCAHRLVRHASVRLRSSLTLS